MKIFIDQEEVFELTSTQQNVIKNDIREEIFEDDMKRRVQYIVEHKYHQCFKRLKDEWEPKLREGGVEMIPTNPDEFAEMVFARPEYKNRSQREVTTEI